jgi:hypothetical protein
MPASPYIPARDGDYDTWLTNFSALITAAPATYGLAAPDAVIIAAQRTAYHDAFVLASDPVTRTAVTVASKDAARLASEAVVRPYAQQITRDAGVDNGDKVALGLNLPNPTRPPIPAPTTAPAVTFDAATPLQHVLRYSDTGSPTGKAKPVGSVGVEVYRKIGVAPEVDPDNAVYMGTVTKSPFRSNFNSADRGKLCTYYLRFVNKSGPGGVAATGPWSAALTIAIV